MNKREAIENLNRAIAECEKFGGVLAYMDGGYSKVDGVDEDLDGDIVIDVE